MRHCRTERGSAVSCGHLIWRRTSAWLFAAGLLVRAAAIIGSEPSVVSTASGVLAGSSADAAGVADLTVGSAARSICATFVTNWVTQLVLITTTVCQLVRLRV